MKNKRIGLCIFAIFTMLSMAGCSYNSASFHANLSQVEMNQIIQDTFCKGMPLDEAKAKAVNLGLHLECWDLAGKNPREGAKKQWICRANIHPPGLYSKPFMGKGGPKWLRTLNLYFSDDFLLERVSMKSYPAPNSGIVTSTMAGTGDIPIRDCDDASGDQK